MRTGTCQLSLHKEIVTFNTGLDRGLEVERGLTCRGSVEELLVLFLGPGQAWKGPQVEALGGRHLQIKWRNCRRVVA